MKWIHTCFDTLIHTLQSLDMNKQVDNAQIQLSHWLRENPKLESTVTIPMLNEEPQSIEQFMTDFNIWENKAKKAIIFAKEMENQQENTEKIWKVLHAARMFPDTASVLFIIMSDSIGTKPYHAQYILGPFQIILLLTRSISAL